MWEVSDAVYQAIADGIPIPRHTAAAWRDLLAPAVAEPQLARAWRHHGTWEAVRAVTGWHRGLGDILARHHWPEVQALWHRQGGPTWDPWGLAVVLAQTKASTISAEFEIRLHHVLRPSAALWVWAVTPIVENWPSLAGLSPALALDRVLRTLIPPADIPGSPHFWHAWAEWVGDAQPDADTPVTSLYPANLFNSWSVALDMADVIEPPAVAGDQLTWWDWRLDAE